MKTKSLTLLALALLGALLLTGCGAEWSSSNETTPPSEKTTPLPGTAEVPISDVLSINSDLISYLDLQINLKGTYQSLVEKIGKEHYEYTNNYSFHKLWNCEDDQLLIVEFDEIESEDGRSPVYIIDQYHIWSSPLKPMIELIEAGSPTKLTVGTPNETQNFTRSITDDQELTSILEQFYAYLSYPNVNCEWYQWIDLSRIETMSYMVEVWGDKDEPVCTIDIELAYDSAYGAAIRYNDGTTLSEWAYCDYQFTQALLTNLYSGELPAIVEPPEFEYRPDLIWAGGYFPNIYSNVEDDLFISEEGEFRLPFLDGATLGQKDRYRFYDPAHETAEFAVYFQYYAYDGDETEKLAPCNWDALVDHLADCGIEEIGREGGFAVPIFAATIAELETLDCDTLQDLMEINDLSDAGLSIMLSYNSDELNVENDMFEYYGKMSPWNKAGE